MKIFIPLIAALALSACGSTAPDNTASESVAVDPVAVDTNSGGAMPAAGGAGAVTITINGVTPGGGPVLVALQDNASFGKAAATYSTTVQPTAAAVTATIPGVAPGSYAAAVVQDTDGDGTLKLGATGPSEPYGFSGTPQTGAPVFDPAAFAVAETGGTATVTLNTK